MGTDNQVGVGGPFYAYHMDMRVLRVIALYFTPIFRHFWPPSSPFLLFIRLHSSSLHSTTSHSFLFISPPLPQDIQTDCKTMKKIFD